MAAKLNLTIDKGTTWRRRIQLKLSGVVVPLDGWSARMHIRPEVDSDTILASLTVDSGITVNTTDDRFELVLTDDVTTDLPGDLAYYDFETIDPDGDVKRLLEGKIKFTPEVTR